MTDDGALIPAVNRLKDAISALIDPRPYTIELDGGHHKRTWLDSRYDQLCDAVAGTNWQGARTLASEIIPLWAAGFDLVAEIDAQVRDWQPEIAGDPRLGWTVLRLQSIDAKNWRPQDTEQIARWAGDLEAWVKRIDSLFGAKPKHLPDPCPRCDVKTALRTTGDTTVRVPALQITLDGAECQNCHHRWPPAELPFLGRRLGYPSIPGVVT